MARIPLIHEDDPAAPPELREKLLRLKQEQGYLVNLRRAMINHPLAFDTFNAFAKTVYRNGSLTPAQAELAYTTATVANSCYY